MAKLNEKQLIVVIIVITLIPTAIFGYLLWRDYQAYQKLSDELELLNGEIKKLEDDLAKVPGMKADLKRRKEVFDEQRKILPSEAELDELGRQIQDKLEEVRIAALKSWKPQQRGGTRRGQKTGAFDTVTYSAEFTADYIQFIEFLNQMEATERFISVEEFKVTPDDETHFLEVDVQLTTYVYEKEIDNELLETVGGTATPDDGGGEENGGEEAAPGEKWEYAKNPTWRNPFETVLETKEEAADSQGTPTPTAPEGLAAGEQAFQDQEKEVQALRRHSRYLRELWGAKDYGRLLPEMDEFVRRMKAAKITYPDLAKQLKDIQAAYDSVKDLVLKDGTFLREWSALRLEAIRANFDEATRKNSLELYQKVIAEYKLVDEKFKSPEYATLVEREPTAGDILTEAAGYANRAEIRVEFSSLPLAVLGIIAMRDTDEKNLSHAIVEYQGTTRIMNAVEDNTIKEAPDLVLESVDEDGVVFSFKKELIRKPIDEPDIQTGGQLGVQSSRGGR